MQIAAGGTQVVGASTHARADDVLECKENQDVPVVVNLMIMRNAGQGFFDIGVNFEDIFCSAKLDCQRDGKPIELLFDPDSGERAPTVVLGFACTAGSNADGSAEPTWLNMSDVVLRCAGSPDVYFEPDQAPGQHGRYGPDGQFFEAAIYRVRRGSPGSTSATGTWRSASRSARRRTVTCCSRRRRATRAGPITATPRPPTR